MIGRKFSHILDSPLEKLAKKIPFHPNHITWAGFFLTLLFSYVLSLDLRIGAFCLLPAVLLDKLDGIVARVNCISSRYGSFLDSVLDRISDSAILAAIAYNLSKEGNAAGIMLCFACLSGSLVISYVRAKAESLGVACNNGLMERPERLILLFIGAVSGQIIAVLWILAILAYATVLQRIYHAGKQLINNRVE